MKKMVIQADEVGAYICLAAIFSGKLPPDAPWEFELRAMPLQLFPSFFVKDKQEGKKRKIRFILEEDCWLKPLKGLCKTPHHLKF